MGFDTERHPLPTADLSRPQAGASLDQRTLLDRHHEQRQRLLGLIYERRPPVGVACYPTAAEATIYECFSERNPSGLDDDGPVGEPTPSEWSDLSDEERDRRNWERANGRAFSESRRYFVANRLRYMWVLTFTGDGLHGPEGRERCMEAVSLFARRLRRHFGPMAYWFSPELHPGGHGWHVNFLIPRRLSHAEVAALWEGRSTRVEGVETGTLWVSDKLKDPRVKSQNLRLVDALRLAALYACKYAVKDWSAENVPSGAHRFVAAAGFKPAKETFGAMTFDEAVQIAIARFDAVPISVWRSADCADWDGPAVVILRFAEPAAGGSDDG